MTTKPTGAKSYGSIGHLPGSKKGWDDVGTVPEGQARIMTLRKRDKHDCIIVQEKLDGSNVGVAKVDGIIYPLTRSGYVADTSPYRQHHVFYKWVMTNYHLFDEVLKEGERMCAEWMLMAHGTRYSIPNPTDLFRPFDIMTGTTRLCYSAFVNRLGGRFRPPHLLSRGEPRSTEWAMNALSEQGTKAFPPDEPEGVVYRVERLGRVDFLAKFVADHHVPGKYFDVETWNFDPNFI